ncbi:hypothetical protein G3I40_38985, partial [Streptomyces sp. SID14478]|nr:hypothetical protein [Streptomyces sp. SID14478]
LVTLPAPVDAAGATATLLTPLGAPVEVPVVGAGRTLTVDAEVPHRAWLLLEWSPSE